MSTAADTSTSPNLENLIKLGDIKAFISPLSIDGAGLEQLGFKPVDRDKASKLYLKSDLPKICASIVERLKKAAESLTR